MLIQEKQRRIDWLAGSLPYVMLLVAGAGFGLTVLLRRTDLSIFSLVLVIPLVLAGAVHLIYKRDSSAVQPAVFFRALNFSHLLLINTIILVSSTVALVSSPTRSLAYFVLISISAGVILMQIAWQRPKWTDNLIVLQIVILSLSLIWGTTLKYPLYFGDTDLLVHFDLIETIVKTGHVAGYNRDYQYYPLYHIFTALGADITGGSIRTVLFVFMGLAWQVGTVFAFLIARALSKSTRFACLVCLLFALSSQVLFYGSYGIARSLAFVFLMCWLYLVVSKPQRHAGYVIISVVVLAALIMTHHLGAFYAIPVLVALYICQLLVNRSREDRLFDPLFIYLFIMGSLAYFLWVASSMAASSLTEILKELFASEGGIKSAFSFTNGFGVSVISGTLYYSFALFFCLLGIRAVLERAWQNNRYGNSVTFALAGFVFLVAFVPGFLYLFPLSDTLLTERLVLLVSPFVVFLMAYGVRYLYQVLASPGVNLAGMSYAAVVPIVLVSVMTLFSATSVGNAKDTNYLPHTATVESPYFTGSELSSFSFLSNNGDTGIRLYADYATSRNDYSLGAFSERSIIQNLEELPAGYLLLRSKELEQKRSLGFWPETPGTEYPIRYPLAELGPQMKDLEQSPSATKIFSDGDVQIYLTR